jgi:hypothetical protein
VPLMVPRQQARTAGDLMALSVFHSQTFPAELLPCLTYTINLRHGVTVFASP